MTHVLRKSVGPWSAGTAVIIRDTHAQEGLYTVEIEGKEAKEGIHFEDLIFDIEQDMVGTLRDRTREGASPNRRERRAINQKAHSIINDLMNTP